MSVIIKHFTKDELDKKSVFSWPVWEKEISAFPWYYDSDEECYILEGEVVVTDDATGTEYTIKKGDFVTFKSGLSCRWNISRAIKKHYNFL